MHLAVQQVIFQCKCMHINISIKQSIPHTFYHLFFALAFSSYLHSTIYSLLPAKRLFGEPLYSIFACFFREPSLLNNCPFVRSSIAKVWVGQRLVLKERCLSVKVFIHLENKSSGRCADAQKNHSADGNIAS